MHLFVVEHLHLQDNGEESAKLIGVYSSQQDLKKAVERRNFQPGFCDTPDDFTIDICEWDEDSWTEGYVTTYHTGLSSAEEK
jgi:hypothetical protein